jgi:solute carrier family 25 (mitochondrial folate transporter), member 32
LTIGPVVRVLELTCHILVPPWHYLSIASTTTYPLQVIKSRLQQRSGESLELTSSGDLKVVRKEYIGFISTVRRIWVAEGIHGFFKGCITNAARVAPGAAITFLVYESVLDVFDYNVL